MDALDFVVHVMFFRVVYFNFFSLFFGYEFIEFYFRTYREETYWPENKVPWTHGLEKGLLPGVVDVSTLAAFAFFLFAPKVLPIFLYSLCRISDVCTLHPDRGSGFRYGRIWVF